MKIILLREWFGSQKGVIKNIEDKYARELIRRGTAREYKQVEEAPRDKMVRGASNKTRRK